MLEHSENLIFFVKCTSLHLILYKIIFVYSHLDKVVFQADHNPSKTRSEVTLITQMILITV